MRMMRAKPNVSSRPATTGVPGCRHIHFFRCCPNVEAPSIGIFLERGLLIELFACIIGARIGAPIADPRSKNISRTAREETILRKLATMAVAGMLAAGFASWGTIPVTAQTQEETQRGLERFRQML